MSMSRKHYVEAAQTIKWTVDGCAELTPVRKAAGLSAAREIASNLANMFARDNGRFSRSQFMDACGLGDPNGN